MEAATRAYYVYNIGIGVPYVTCEPHGDRTGTRIVVPNSNCNHAHRANHMSGYASRTHRTCRLTDPMVAGYLVETLILIGSIGMLAAIDVLEKYVASMVDGNGHAKYAETIDLAGWYERMHDGSDDDVLAAIRVRDAIFARKRMIGMMHAQSIPEGQTRFVVRHKYRRRQQAALDGLWDRAR
jgi:hypothetical protein